MDNQQATPIELSYLAGLWDGEGTITVSKGKMKNNNIQYSPRISLGNTEVSMINEIVKTLDKVGIRGYIFTEEKEAPRKDMYKIVISKFDQAKKLLEIILPYLKVKKAQGELLLRFLKNRIEIKNGKRQELITDKKGRIVGSIRHDLYRKEDVKLVDQLRSLNKKGKSSETIR